jgi:hypothetical protein
MNEQTFLELLKLATIGGGLLTLGISNLLLQRRSVLLRLAVNGALLALLTVGMICLNAPKDFMLLVGGILLSSTLILGGIGTSSFRIGLTTLIHVIQRPMVRFGVMSLGGIAFICYGIYRFEADDEAMLDHDIAMFERMAYRPPLHVDFEHLAYTDVGNPIELNAADEARSGGEIAELEQDVLTQLQFNFSLIRNQPPDETSNCHGWVFTGGKYWLGPEMVAKILTENNYEPVVVPQVGDVVIYRNNTGIVHTAIVRYVGGDVPIVEGKWGWMGVFLHPVDHSCYGQEYTYYRSPREGHLIVGLGGKPAERSRSLPPITDIERRARNY